MRSTTLFALLIGVTSCQQTPAPQPSAKSFPVGWSSAALELAANENPTAAFAKPLEDAFEVRKGKDKATANNCASVLRVLAEGFQPPSDRDFQVFLVNALRCRALEVLAQAKPAQESFLTDFHLETSSLNMLPAALASAVSGDQEAARKQAMAKGRTWAALEPDAKVLAEKTGEHNTMSLEVDSGAFGQRLEVIAHGDFDGDGIEDWLITDDTFARQGSYRASRMLLVTRSGTTEPLRVIRELNPGQR